ncbi:MAG: universal stress protein [Acidobacteria bacterium]|nr:universal stress protein [Acidobacteriota bacterium]
MNILLAIDDSKYSEAAVQALINQFRLQDTTIRVVHVTEPITFAFPPEIAAEYAATPHLTLLRQDQLKKAEALVQAAAAKLRSANFNVETAVYEGDVRSEIVDLASQWPADLIVVGSHGRKGLNRFLMGSVSEFVARHAPCSVEVVRAAA